MIISQETVDKLKEIYGKSIYFNKENHDYDNECDPKEANYIGVGFTPDGDYIGAYFAAPKKKEVTLEWALNKINAKSEYISFVEDFNKLLKKKHLDVSAYPTTYGIGIFSFHHASLKDSGKIDDLLNELGIQFKKEFSDARYVLRYKISKNSINMGKIKNFVNEYRVLKFDEFVNEAKRKFDLPDGYGYGKNKKMDNDVYKLRRKVINIIYEIKQFVPNLPRIDVRITDDHTADKKNIAGLAQMGKLIVWIPEGTVNKSETYIRNVVYHEVLHAVYGVGHVKGCPLMDSHIPMNLNKEEAKKLFLKHIKL